MTLTEAVDTIGSHLSRMNALYGKTVFDEWAVIEVLDRRGRILHYVGSRREDMARSFSDDIGVFRNDLVGGDRDLGYFEFAPDASGTTFDAYVVVGEGCFLVCNNTTQSISGITREPRWLQAQVPFAELSEVFRSNPLIHLA